MKSKPSIPLFYDFYVGTSREEALQESVKHLGYTDKSEIERVIQCFPEPVLYIDQDKKIEAYELINPRSGKMVEIGIQRANWFNPPAEGYALFMFVDRKLFHKVCLQTMKKD